MFVEQDFPSVVVVGLSKKAAGVNDQENWNEGKENIRVAVAGYFTLDVYLILMEIPTGLLFKIPRLPFFGHLAIITPSTFTEKKLI